MNFGITHITQYNVMHVRDLNLWRYFGSKKQKELRILQVSSALWYTKISVVCHLTGLPMLGSRTQSG